MNESKFPLSLNPEIQSTNTDARNDANKLVRYFIVTERYRGTHSSKMDWKKIEIKLSFIC